MKMMLKVQLESAENTGKLTEALSASKKGKGVAQLKVNLEMPKLPDKSFRFWHHWRKCENVARCQTAGSTLTSMDFLSLWSETFEPKGGVRDKHCQLLYDRALRAERLPDDAEKVLIEIRDEVAKKIRETPLETAERLEEEYACINMGVMDHAIDADSITNKRFITRVTPPSYKGFGPRGP